MSIIKRNDGFFVLDLKKLSHLLLKNLPLILAVGILCGGLTYGYTYYKVTPVYTAYTRMYVNNNKQNLEYITTNDLNASAQLVKTYSAIISSNTMMEEVAEKSGLDITGKSIVNKIRVSSVNNTEVFMVQVTDPDPERAALLANTIAEVVPKKLAKMVKGSTVTVIDYAEVPTRYSSPNYRRNAQSGFLLGCLVAVLLILIRALMDTTIKSKEDFEEWDYPVLGVIPDFKDAKKLVKNKYYGYYSADEEDMKGKKEKR